ncbi:hypothetical protein PVIIG_02233 [Plasmodium vivax India VII]|uniref:Uncharacterized protein n=6 Tax=Plasmodium vivax TaxID=5855 RepID=A5K148_PLAVS|nr:hypothetical protein, conserved [Plasmodium vivax]KMZ78234.1 hypothetical protein PVIIG_02233 [Plasmodium vivax India VII]KMZ83839.1 hypothetical protein PVBG_00919 [Plasmodium vivax Brazil I]KMZ90676.1 hypothetical protein PVMG_02845 [Plasmodium vivax Mauritania I]KMZ97361.1 hypothetical protein PVNG_01191 [Plasmodium vivax North Korean]EDL47045.1 hypothetical protein, conserved [Plasmodium vivax]|eukprot:XP_001616772.1 hypothetical protein [Plasmodium vivax Sal-1]
MHENQKNDEKERSGAKISRESLLDDQFKEGAKDKLFLLSDKDEDLDVPNDTPPEQKTKREKPRFHKDLISSSSLEKYKKFLAKMEKSNEDLRNMDTDSVRIDKDILDQSCENSDEACVVMDVSMGIFDVCNDNLSESKLKDMNITVADVVNQEPEDQGEEGLIQEM